MNRNDVKKSVFILVSCCLLLSAAGEELTLRIIQTTDLHGSIDHGRLARTATLVEQETQAAGGPDKSLRIDCGDLIQGTYAMTDPEGRALMIHFLNRLSFDVFVPGNHDFEFGSASLLVLLRQFRGTVLAVNLDWKNAPVLPWKMFRRNGLNIAVIGIAYPALDRMFLPQILGQAHSREAGPALEKIIPQVIRSRPDLIVLAVHAGEHTRLGPGFTMFDLIRKFPQIDLVLCGHSHRQDAGRMIGANTWRMQSPALAYGIGVAEIRFDSKKKRITSLQTRLIPIDQVGEHPEIRNQVNELNRKISRSGRRKIAAVPFELRPPEKTEIASALTDLYGRAVMAHTGAEIVFYGVNSRFRLNPGILNEFLLFRLMPYDDYAVTVDLTAGEIQRILTEQLQIHRKGGMYQPPCGLRFTVLRRRPAALMLASSGRPLEDGRTYRTAFSSYIFSGSGRCPVLHAIVKQKKAGYFSQTVRKMVMDYLQENYPIKTK
ncbi:MAG: bifunctional metallophosphatase/5'-nucleotidase [Lentisphaeria bacterium]|nr:bifunctional metallophosphatase/5'-nucleotidase [Lentisphaeria bacterium]